MRISKQSPICSRGERFSHSIDLSISVQCNTKTAQETQRSLQKFLEPDRNPKVIYTDNSLELGKACEELSRNHCTSTPHRSETNGIAERAVRRAKEGTSAVLLQSGLNESWWAAFYGMLYLSAKRSWSLVWWEDTIWETIWATIPTTYHSVCFIGWVSSYYCEGPVKNPSIWKESLTWIVPRIRRVTYWLQTLSWGVGDDGRIGNLLEKTAKEVIFPKEKGEHIPPSRWTQSQTLLAERRIIPYTTEIHWRLQNYSYEFGCQARTPHRWLLEYRWVNRFVWFLDRFHSVYSIRRKNLQMDIRGLGGDCQESS